METLDNIETLDAKPKNVNGHGGKRLGAGGKPKGYVPPPEKVDFDKARARNEAAKAALNEHDLKVKMGEYVAREVVRSVAAQTAATIAQSLRSIPDTLERKGVAPAVCMQISDVIDEVLNDLADQFALMTPDNGISQ